MHFADHFDGCSFIYEDDCTTVTNEYLVDPDEHTSAMPFKRQDAGAYEQQHANIRAWLSDVIIEEENKPLVTDVLHALGNLQSSGPGTPQATMWHASGRQTQARTTVNVHTLGPGFGGRAPQFASSEFFANLVVVAILLMFAPGFTLLAASVFVTSRVAERWAGQQ